MKFIEERFYHVWYKEFENSSERFKTYIAKDIAEAIELCKEHLSYCKKSLTITRVDVGDLVYRPSTKTITVDV